MVMAVQAHTLKDFKAAQQASLRAHKEATKQEAADGAAASRRRHYQRKGNPISVNWVPLPSHLHPQNVDSQTNRNLKLGINVPIDLSRAIWTSFGRGFVIRTLVKFRIC